MKQACAAVGQSQLMALYESGFQHFDVATAQILLTEDDFVDAVRYSNLRATLETLLKLGMVPVINENDTVSTIELESPGDRRRRVRESRRTECLAITINCRRW